MSAFLHSLRKVSSRRRRPESGEDSPILQRPLDAAGSEAAAVAKVSPYEDEDVIHEGYLEKHVTTLREGESVNEWSQRHLKLTTSRLLFSFDADGPIREDIFLEDIDILVSLGEDSEDKKPEKKTASTSSRGTRSAVLSGLEWDNGMRIYTEKYGRNMYLRATDKEHCKVWIDTIAAQRDARIEQIERLGQKTLAQRLRPRVAAVTDSMQFQTFVAVLLFLNFSLNIYEVEVKPAVGSSLEKSLELVDVVFTVFYVIELLLNLFVHWWREFVFNGWSVFDSICVISSVVGMVLTAVMDGKIDLSVIRSLRIFKIVRIFSRLKALQRIVTAITSTVYPLFNTFLIFVVVIAIYSVLASQLYGEIFPQRFGSFTAASLTMFQLSTGDGWLTDVVRPLMDLGYEQEGPTFNIIASIFFITFILFVMVVLINVAVAVLLEGFLSAISGMEASERAHESAVEYNKIAGPLDPLLATLANFHSEEHLSSQIALLFGFIDIDAGGSVTFEEFKQGVETIDSRPPMLVTREDFDSFTRGGTLLNQDLALDARAFDKCMRLQMRNYAQRLIAHQMTEAVRHQQSDSAEYFAHKVLISEMFKLANKVQSMAQDVHDIRAQHMGDGDFGADSQTTTPMSPARVQLHLEHDVDNDNLVQTAKVSGQSNGRIDGNQSEHWAEPTASTLLAMISELKTIALDTQSRVQRCEELLATIPVPDSSAALVPTFVGAITPGPSAGTKQDASSSPVDAHKGTSTSPVPVKSQEFVSDQRDSPNLVATLKSKSQPRSVASSIADHHPRDSAVGQGGVKFNPRAFAFGDLPFSSHYLSKESPLEYSRRLTPPRHQSLEAGGSTPASWIAGAQATHAALALQSRRTRQGGEAGDDMEGIKYGRARRNSPRIQPGQDHVNATMERISAGVNGKMGGASIDGTGTAAFKLPLRSSRTSGDAAAGQGGDGNVRSTLPTDGAGERGIDSFPTPSKWM